jgi:hypothetical protein
MKEQIRFTETNSGDDSKGRTWGLEGDLFWVMAGGAFVFVMTLLVCFSALKMNLLSSLLLAAMPLTLCVIYIFVFRQGKPAGYDIDCLDYWLNGSGFGPEFQKRPAHPLCLNNHQLDSTSMT